MFILDQDHKILFEDVWDVLEMFQHWYLAIFSIIISQSYEALTGW